MNRGQFAVTLVAVVVAGLVGGMLSDWMRGEPAYAQENGKQLVVDELVAKKITVSGEQDTWRLDTVGLHGIDRDGQERVSLSATRDPLPGPILFLQDTGGAPRIQMGLGTKGGGFIYFGRPGDGYPTATYSAEGLMVQRPDGPIAFRLLLPLPGQGDEPSLLMRDVAGKARVTVGNAPGTDEWGFELLDANGNSVWRAP